MTELNPANPTNHESIVRMILDSHNKRDFTEVLQKHVSDELVITSCATPVVLRGKEGFARYYRAWDTAIPDGRVEATRLFSSGDCVTVELRGGGTQSGPLETPYGTLPPTGRKVQATLCDVFEFRDGKLVGLRNYSDLAGMLSQLGARFELQQRESKAA